MTTSTTPAIKFINIEQHMTSEQAGINAQLLAEGYSRQHIVLTFIAGCYGVSINQVRLLGRSQYAVKGLNAACALPINIVRYLTPVVAAKPLQVKAEARTKEEVQAAVEKVASKTKKTRTPKHTVTVTEVTE